jgi:hypothetical protein
MESKSMEFSMVNDGLLYIPGRPPAARAAVARGGVVSLLPTGVATSMTISRVKTCQTPIPTNLETASHLPCLFSAELSIIRISPNPLL